MTATKFDIVVACDLARGIGVDNKLPWRLSADMKYFRELTQGNAVEGRENFVIMGRNTWLSIPAKNRPLPHRGNIVLTRDPFAHRLAESLKGAEVCLSLEDALDFVDGQLSSPVQSVVSAYVSAEPRCFVIGGAKVYERAVVHSGCDRLYLTQIKDTFKCDVFFPSFEDKFVLLSETEEQEENGIPFSFKVYKRAAATQ